MEDILRSAGTTTVLTAVGAFSYLRGSQASKYVALISGILDANTYTVRLVSRATGMIHHKQVFSLPASSFQPVLLKDIAMPSHLDGTGSDTDSDGDGEGDGEGEDETNGSEYNGRSGGGDSDCGDRDMSSARGGVKRVAELRPKRSLFLIAMQAAAAVAVATAATAVTVAAEGVDSKGGLFSGI